ncbi:CheY-P phosphatase CheC [Clostridium acetireducens DSM 10703]|jgi:chemotaxis protein CheC|uniref:CheY-P phosphatase CheC n=1 Tax=Clostridium acetireducens DSM 10703 TaxID=1121290 RepID=A0A1E8F0P9_9CLOT|nr:chemotaxis protein CheC [Clostridium acetireducens]OFI06995.1 CheY-P phosphatase CheC [Clostridium acetireducens DSM 10703]
MLTKEQNDILKELMNIYVGRAAKLLSEIINKRINLSVPELHIILPQFKSEINKEKFPEFLKGTLMSSSLSFGEEFTGKAELVFPTDKIKVLTSLCLGEDDFLDLGEENFNNFNDIDFDVMKEIGNIILNSVMGGIGDLLNTKLQYTVPEIELFDIIEYRKRIIEKQDVYFILMYVSFTVEDTEIQGAILTNFSLNSITQLMDKINEIKKELEYE